MESENHTPDTNGHRWYQFRLRSLLILMTIVACSLFVTQWRHRQIVSGYETVQWSSSNTRDDLSKRAEMERRFTLPMSLFVFIGSCGLWYAVKNRHSRIDCAIGCQFGLLLFCLWEPTAAKIPLEFLFESLPNSDLITFALAALFLLIVLLVVLSTFVGWPLFFKRNVPAVLLLISYKGNLLFCFSYSRAYQDLFYV